MAARRVEPGHADPIPFLDERHACAEGDNDPDRLMPRDEGRLRLQRPVAIGGVQIGVADAAGLGLDEDLARPGGGDIPFLKFQRLFEGCDDSRMHLLGHGVPPSGFGGPV